MQGILSPIIDGFILPFLKASYLVIPNYGIGIILLTLLIKLLFYPLTKKQFESMKSMQVLQPKLKALQEKYKKNPQQLQGEMMKLYKQEKVNPLGGCLPILVQIPIFFAFFYTMTSDAFVALISQEGVYSGFIPYWINYLDKPDPFYILPLFIGLSTYLTQKFSPSLATGPSAQFQKNMMLIFPFMMVFICLNMPAGVLLYWATQQLVSGIQQMSILKTIENKKEAT